MPFYRKSYRPRRGGEEPEKCADPAKARARALDALSAREMHQKMLGCAFSVQVNLKMQGNWMKIPLLPKKLDNKQEAFFVTQ